MTLSTADKDAIERRREVVAQLRLRQLTVREIAAQLPKLNPPILNPENNEPYTHTTIINDLKALKAEWRKSAGAAIAEHQAMQLAEIQQLKKAAWGGKDYGVVLRCLEREAKLLGLDEVSENQNGIEIIIRREDHNAAYTIPAPGKHFEQSRALQSGSDRTARGQDDIGETVH